MSVYPPPVKIESIFNALNFLGKDELPNDDITVNKYCLHSQLLNFVTTYLDTASYYAMQYNNTIPPVVLTNSATDKFTYNTASPYLFNVKYLGSNTNKLITMNIMLSFKASQQQMDFTLSIFKNPTIDVNTNAITGTEIPQSIIKKFSYSNTDYDSISLHFHVSANTNDIFYIGIKSADFSENHNIILSNFTWCVEI